MFNFATKGAGTFFMQYSSKWYKTIFPVPFHQPSTSSSPSSLRGCPVLLISLLVMLVTTYLSNPWSQTCNSQASLAPVKEILTCYSEQILKLTQKKSRLCWEPTSVSDSKTDSNLEGEIQKCCVDTNSNLWEKYEASVETVNWKRTNQLTQECQSRMRWME